MLNRSNFATATAFFLSFALCSATYRASATNSIIQEASKRPIASRTHSYDRVNDNVVTILSGNRDGDSLGIVYDLSEILDNGENLRVLPAVGRGSAQNVRDVLGLRGIDMGIAHSNLLNHFAKTGELGDIKTRITYVAKLFNEEMHVVATAGIGSLRDLDGKSVNFGEVGSGTQLTSKLVFQALGIRVHEINLEQQDALAAIKAGRIAATILITGKPSKLLASLNPSDGFKLVPIAFTAPLISDYYPATFEHSDYPNLISNGAKVDTVANCAVIIAFNWPKGSDRYRKVAKFVDAFFDHFGDFRASRQGMKWQEVNFAATLEGWKRFPEAQFWIDNSRATDADKSQFEKFLQSKVGGEGAASTAQRDALFREYVRWKQVEGKN